MKTHHNSYEPVLKEVQSISVALQTRLDAEQLQMFIRDVLLGEVDGIYPYLDLNSLPLAQRLSNSPSDLVFDFLAKQPAEWLEQQCGIFESLYQEWREDSWNEMPCQRLISLVASVRVGLDPMFIESLLKKGVSREEELVLYLLWAKILERDGDSLGLFERIDIIKKPHLVAVILYLYRKENPRNGIAALIGVDNNISQNVYGPSVQERDYLKVYLRRSIHNLLRDARDETYHDFFDLQGRFQEGWIKELFGEVMQHPSLASISKRSRELNEAIMDEEVQMHRISVLEQEILNYGDNE